MQSKIESVGKRLSSIVCALAIWVCAILVGFLALSKTAYAAPPAQSPVDLCSLLPSGGQKVYKTFASCQAEYESPDASYILDFVISYDNPLSIKQHIASLRGTPITDIGDQGAVADSGRHIIIGRGCYMLDASGSGAVAQPLRQAVTQIDQKLKSAPQCQLTPTSSPPAASSQLRTSGACSYVPPNGSKTGVVTCAAASSGQLPNAEIAYIWSLDGVQQSETGSTLTRADDQLTPGAHTANVVAIDTENNVRGIGVTLDFTAVGSSTASSAPTSPAAPTSSAPAAAATFAVALTCSVSSDLDCKASVSGAPADADLQYAWWVDGTPQKYKFDSFTESPPSQGAHYVSVVATDRKSGKTAQATTTFIVGDPLQTAINVALTGQTNPDPVDLARVAGASVAVTILVGLGLLPQLGTQAQGGSTGSSAPGKASKLPTTPPGPPPGEWPKPTTLPGTSPPKEALTDVQFMDVVANPKTSEQLAEEFANLNRNLAEARHDVSHPGSNMDLYLRKLDQAQERLENFLKEYEEFRNQTYHDPDD